LTWSVLISLFVSLSAGDPGTGPEEEEELPGKEENMYSTEDLDIKIPLSRHEITTTLDRQLRAFEIGGVWRVLSEEFESEVLRTVLATISEEGWDPLAFPLLRCIAIVSRDVAPPIVAHILKLFGGRVGEGNMKDGEGGGGGRGGEEEVMWAIQPEEVARFFGILVIRKRRRISVTQFQTEWHDALPTDLPCPLSLSLLRGHAVVVGDDQREGGGGGGGGAGEGFVVVCESSGLPQDLRLRFAALFDIKRLWSAEELEPFCDAFVSPRLSFKQILLKYTRSVQQGPQRLYCAR
jgi:hypothetical protein